MPAEYGNALSGAFDMKMRVGNNAKYEHAIQVGTLGDAVGPERLLVKPKELGWWPDAYLSFPFGWHADLQRRLYRHLSEAGESRPRITRITRIPAARGTLSTA